MVDEQLTVDAAEINRPIPELVFTEAGFGMPAGTPLAYPEVKRPENQPTWTGEGIDRTLTSGQQAAEAYRAMSQSEPPTPDTPEPGRNWPYYLGGGVLAVVGGVLVTRAVRRRAAAG